MRLGVVNGVKAIAMLGLGFLFLFLRASDGQCASEIEEESSSELQIINRLADPSLMSPAMDLGEDQKEQASMPRLPIPCANPRLGIDDPSSCFCWRPRNDLLFQVREDLFQTRGADRSVGFQARHLSQDEESRAKLEKEKKIARLRQTVCYLSKYAEAILNRLKFLELEWPSEPLQEEGIEWPSEPSQEDLNWVPEMQRYVQSFSKAIASYQTVLQDPDKIPLEFQSIAHIEKAIGSLGHCEKSFDDYLVGLWKNKYFWAWISCSQPCDSGTQDKGYLLSNNLIQCLMGVDSGLDPSPAEIETFRRHLGLTHANSADDLSTSGGSTNPAVRTCDQIGKQLLLEGKLRLIVQIAADLLNAQVTYEAMRMLPEGITSNWSENVKQQLRSVAPRFASVASATSGPCGIVRSIALYVHLVNSWIDWIRLMVFLVDQNKNGQGVQGQKERPFYWNLSSVWCNANSKFYFEIGRYVDAKVWGEGSVDSFNVFSFIYIKKSGDCTTLVDGWLSEAVEVEDKLKQLSAPQLGRHDLFLEGVGYLDFLELKRELLTKNAGACRNRGILSLVFLPWILEFAREKLEQSVDQKIADYKACVEAHFSRVSLAEKQAYLQKAHLKNAVDQSAQVRDGSSGSGVFDEASEVAAACESSDSLATRWGLHAWSEAMCGYRLAMNELAISSKAQLKERSYQVKEQLLKRCKRKLFDWADKMEQRVEACMLQSPAYNPASGECALVRSCCEKQLMELQKNGKGVDNVFKHDICKNPVEYCADDKTYDNNRRGRPLISHQNWYRFVRTQVNLGAIHAILGGSQNGSSSNPDAPSLQLQLLKVLEENEFERGFLKMGSAQPEHYDFSEYRSYGFGHIAARDILADHQKGGIEDQIWRKIQRHKVFLKSEYILSLLPQSEVLKFLKGRIFVCLREWAHLLVTAQSCPDTARSIYLIRAAIASLIGYHDFLEKVKLGVKQDEVWTQTRCGDRSVSHLDGQSKLGLPQSYLFHKPGQGVADEAYYLPLLSPEAAQGTLNQKWILGIVIPNWDPEVFKFRFEKALSNHSGKTDEEFLRLLRIAMNTLNR